MLNAQQKFKTTPVGEIPVDWECVRLGKVLKILTGFPFSSKTYSPSGHLLCRGDNVGVGKIKWDNAVHCDDVDDETASKFAIEEFDILLAMDRTWINEGIKMALATSEDSGALVVQRVARLRCSKPSIATLFSAHFTTKRFEYFVKGSQQEGGGVPHISKAQIDSYLIPLPPLSEQQKIANILGTWDRAIETQQKLIAALTQRKKALAQQLLTGKSRLPGFEEPWEMAQLGGLFQRVTKKNTDGHTQVVTISAQQGLVCQQDYFNKQIASTLLDNYYVLGRGQFAYNKSYSKGYPMGAIKRLNRYDHGVVTTLYICFAIRSPQSTSSDFWEHYFESGSLNRGITRIAHEGGRAHGLLNVTPKDFFELNIHRPTLPEQIAIAKVLTTADRELALHTQNLTTLQTQKRALMQQLLTGKVRVTI